MACSLGSALTRPDAGPSPGFRLRAALLAIVLLHALGGPAHAAANSFGRWWWEAQAGIGQHSSKSKSGRSQGLTSTNSRADLSLALNGFLGHPALGSFRLDLDLAKKTNEASRTEDNELVGFGIDVDLPGGYRVPSGFYFRRTAYDHSVRGPGVFSSFGAPESSEVWGGKMSVLRGALRGINLNYDQQQTTSLLDDRDLSERKSFHWNRATRRFSNSVSIEDSRREIEAFGSRTRDLTGNLSQNAQLTPTWRWTMTGSAAHRRSGLLDNGEVSSESLNWSAGVTHDVRHRDTLQIGATLGRFSTTAEQATTSRDVSVSYQWRPSEAWLVSPQANYFERSGEIELESPRVGVTASWQERYGSYDIRLTGDGTYGVRRFRSSTMSQDDSDLSYGITGTLSHAGASGLRKTVEFDVSRNQIRVQVSPLFDLPDLGLAGEGSGAHDSERLRFRLNHAWDSTSLNGWFEWRRSERGGELMSESFRTETLRGYAEYNRRGMSVEVGAGDTDVERLSGRAQRVRFASTRLTWKPNRFLRLHAAYRSDKRMVDLLPDVDGERVDAGLTFRIGLVELKTFASMSTQQVGGGSRRESESLSWSLRRRFAGWLPVVTGTRRRGTIR